VVPCYAGPHRRLALGNIAEIPDSYVSDSAGPSWIDRWYLDELENRTEPKSPSAVLAGSLNKVGEGSACGAGLMAISRDER